MRYMCSNCFDELDKKKSVCDKCSSKTKTVIPLDDEIVDSVIKCNKNGLNTLFACSGHIYDGDSDPYPQGYVVFVFKNNKEARKFIKDNFDMVSVYGDTELSAIKYLINTKSHNYIYDVYDIYIAFRNRDTNLFISKISEKYTVKIKNHIKHITIVNKPKKYESCVILRSSNALGAAIDDVAGSIPKYTVEVINKIFRDMLAIIADRKQNERK